MLPVFTTGQVKDGINSGDFMIDLSEYIKKKDAATKVELSTLTSVVANKLDAEPQHKHHISDIKELQEALQGKYDTNEKYSYSTIISDIEKIPYLEAPKIKMLSLGDLETENPYKFYVDEASGDLMISYDDILLANYSKSTNNWTFGGVNIGELINLKGDNMNTTAVLSNHDERISENLAKINEYITKTDAVLKNHYDVLLELCEKHGMVDANTGDGDKLTPQAE